MIQALMSNLLSSNNNYNSESSGIDSEETPSMATDKNKKDWNDFLIWLDEKKVRGKKDLDTNDLGNKYFDEYISTHKDTSLSKDVIPAIRNAYIDLRNTGVQQIKEGKATFLGKKGDEADTNSFMKHIIMNEQTSNPNYVGQHLTQTFFPDVTTKEFLNNKLINTNIIKRMSSKDVKIK